MAILASFGHPAGGVLHQPLAPGPRGSRRAHPRPEGTPARRESSTGVDGAGRAGSADRPPGSSS